MFFRSSKVSLNVIVVSDFPVIWFFLIVVVTPFIDVVLSLDPVISIPKGKRNTITAITVVARYLAPFLMPLFLI